jgi:hypothetical protein
VETLSLNVGSPVPKETTKLGSSTRGNIATTSKRAKTSGSFSSGLASWKVPTLLICLGGKNLLKTLDTSNRRGLNRLPRCSRYRSRSIYS